MKKKERLHHCQEGCYTREHLSLSLSLCRACVNVSRQKGQSKGRLSTWASVADGIILSDG